MRSPSGVREQFNNLALTTRNMVFQFYKTVPKIAAGQHLVPKFRITSHVHLAVSYYKCLPQKSPLPLSRKSFYSSIPKGSSPFTSAPLSHYPPMPRVYEAALRPALHCGVHNPPSRGKAAPSHVLLNPPGQLVSRRSASEPQPWPTSRHAARTDADPTPKKQTLNSGPWAVPLKHQST